MNSLRQFLLGLGLLLASCSGQKVADTYLDHDLYGSCVDGELAACHAFALSQSKGTVADKRGALIALRYACHMNHADSCAEFAVVLGQTSESKRGTLNALEQACEGGNTEACVLYGDALPGYQSKPYYKRACEASNGDGCARLAAKMRASWRLEVELTRAFELEATGCEMGSSIACVAAGQALLFGSGIPTDPSRGLQLLERTCTPTDGTGCLILARLYETGTGLAQDLGQANTYYELASSHSKEPIAATPAAAFVIYTDGCNRGDVLGCFNAGWDLAEGTDVPRNISTSRDLFDRACKDGLDSACEKWTKIRPATETIGGGS